MVLGVPSASGLMPFWSMVSQYMFRLKEEEGVCVCGTGGGIKVNIDVPCMCPCA